MIFNEALAWRKIPRLVIKLVKPLDNDPVGGSRLLGRKVPAPCHAGTSSGPVASHSKASQRGCVGPFLPAQLHQPAKSEERIGHHGADGFFACL